MGVKQPSKEAIEQPRTGGLPAQVSQVSTNRLKIIHGLRISGIRFLPLTQTHILAKIYEQPFPPE